MTLTLSLMVLTLLMVALQYGREGLVEAQTRAIWAAALAGLAQGLTLLPVSPWPAIAAMLAASVVALSAAHNAYHTRPA